MRTRIFPLWESVVWEMRRVSEIKKSDVSAGELRELELDGDGDLEV